MSEAALPPVLPPLAAPPAPPTAPAHESVHAGAAHELAEEHESLAGAFRQRALALWHAGVRLRLLTAVAVAVLVLTTVLAFAVDAPMPRVPVATNDGHLVTIGGPIYVLSVLLLSLAWAYLLTGVVHARWPVHVGGMVAYSLAFADPIQALAINPVMMLVALGVLALTWVVGFSHRLVRRDRGLGLVLPGLHFFLALGLYVACYIGSLTTGSALLFGFATSIQLVALQFFLIPVVFLSGTDFAEWGEVAGTWLAEQVRRFGQRAARVLAVGTALVGVATIADAARQYRGALPRQVVPLALAVLLTASLVAAGRFLRHRRPVRVPFSAMVLGAVLFLVTLTAVAIGVAATPSEREVAGVVVSRYVHSQDPPFSIDQPSLWEVRPSQQPVPQVTFLGQPAGNPGQFTIVAAPAAELGDDAFATWVARYFPGQSTIDGAPGPSGEWTERTVDLTMPDGSHLVGHAWQRDAEDRTWLLYGISKPSIASLDDPLYAGLVASWSPDAKAEAAARTDTGPMIAVMAIPWALALIGIVVFLGLRRRARAGLATGLLFMALVAVLYVTSQLGEIFTQLRLPVHVDGLRETGLQAGIGVAAIALAAWAWARGRLAEAAPLLALLATLMVGLQVVSWIFALFDLKVSGSGLLQTALIVAALAWDVVMGGGAIAQGHGRWFPRHSRVLVYFGYDILVAAAVLFFAALQDQVTGKVPENGFETDFWAQNGLLMLGMPMLVTLFVVKLGRIRAPE